MAVRSKLLVFATMLALAACGESETQVQNSDQSVASATASNVENTTAVVDTNNPAWETLNIGSEANFPPLRYTDEHGNVLGFHADIIRAAAKAAELNVKFVVTRDIRKLDLLPKNENYQVILGTFANNEANRQYADFSDSIVTSKFMAFLKQKEGKTTGTLEDLKDKKVSIDEYYDANPAIHEALVKATGSEKDIIVKDQYFVAWQTMVREESDAMFSDNLMFIYTQNQYKDRVNYGYKAVDLGIPNEVPLLFEKSQSALLTKFNKGLATIKSNGEYDAIQKKWFGDVN
jgi:ABC transporter, substrate-binding protein, family 3